MLHELLLQPCPSHALDAWSSKLVLAYQTLAPTPVNKTVK